MPLASVVSGTSSSVDNFDSACAEVTSVSHSTSGLSPHANIFKPSQLLKNDSGVESTPLDRSASLPRSFREAQNRNSNTEEVMDTGDSNNISTKQTSSFNLPPQIDQSIFRSNSPVNIPSPSRSNSHTRVNRSTTPVNGGSKQSHVSRSRSVARKSPGRRKLSNSISRRKGQGSAELSRDNNKQQTA